MTMPAATLTLTDFLLARIAEDEAVARDWPDDRTLFWADDQPVVDTLGHVIYQPRTRVLAECEAKRRLLEWHRQYDTDERGEPHGREDQCPAWRLLASVYADHPDYRKEWRP
jgi:hypothetical protein